MHTEPLDTQGRQPADEDSSLFELYHENSKQRRHDLEFARRIYMVNNSASVHEVVAQAFKGYPGAAFTPLPTVQPREGPSFEAVAARRRSIRRFATTPLHLDELARMAYFGNGLTGHLDASGHGVVQPVRAAPSGGALYPVELYVAISAVDGLSPGIYHYAVDRHGLESLREGDWAGRLSEITSDQDTFSGAAVVFILTSVTGRAHFKYGERAYRFALLEAGHVCQNILLAATAQELGAVAVGGFIDDELNELLGIDGVDEAAVYLMAAGYPAKRPVADPDETAEDLMNRLLDSLPGNRSAADRSR